MRFVCLGLALLTLGGLVSACDSTSLDPTENTFAPQIVNDTPSTAKVDYCNRSSSCGPTMWTETLRAGESASGGNISAGPGDLSVFEVKERGAIRCIRLERYVAKIQLSEATMSACHPPYG